VLSSTLAHLAAVNFPYSNQQASGVRITVTEGFFRMCISKATVHGSRAALLPVVLVWCSLRAARTA
jgi:hypothetical protein